MSIQIQVPAMGESVTEATVARWFKKEGDQVARDEPILELETDKVAVEVPAPADGALESIAVKEGDTVQVGTVLGVIAESKAGAKSTLAAKGKETSTPVAAAPVTKPSPPPVQPKPVQPAASTTVVAMPSARRVAEESGLDLGSVAGTGKDGRVTKGDALALRLKESQNTAAQLTTFNEVDMSHVMSLRAEYKESFEKKHGVRLGFMGFFVKACIAALKELPNVNGEIEGNDVIYKNYYDIGVAVSTERGLIVPVVRDADKLSLAQIEASIHDFGLRARDNKLKLDELQGGTFTISNGGVFGSLMSTPILNAPQSGILGMHKIQPRPVAEGDKIVIKPMMYLALSYDHRLVDGREAVTFLVRVKENLEDPQRLLLDI